MDEIAGDYDDIDTNKLVFIGINKEKFNFNTFDMPINFLSNIYNVKISLKEAEFNQRDLGKPKNTKKSKRKKRIR